MYMCRNNISFKVNKTSVNRTVWLYWENAPGKSKPYYIDLCHQLVKKFNPNSKVIILDQNTVKNYVTLPDQWYSLKEIAHRADYVRISVLYKYGGIWLDSDMVCLDSFDKIFDMLENNDFVAFELKNKKNSNGKVVTDKNNTYRVFLAFLATRPKSLLFKEWLTRVDKIMSKPNNQEWHFIGRTVMNPLLKKLVESRSIRYKGIKAEDGILPIVLGNLDTFYSETTPLSTAVKTGVYQPFVTLFNSGMARLNSVDDRCINSGKMLICRLLKHALDKKI